MANKDVDQELKDDLWLNELCQAIRVCGEDQQLLLKLLRDVFTFSELKRAGLRWAAGRLLLDGHTQTWTANELSLSTKTVNNMAKWSTGYAATGGIATAYHRLKTPKQD